MALPITFALVTLALFALFWGGTLVAQGYLYQQPAERLPLRAIAAALLVGGFLSFWVWVDRQNPGKYDTFFEFAGETSRDLDEFEAVRWHADPGPGGKVEFRKDAAGKPAETTTKYKRPIGGGRSAVFVEEGTGKRFALNDTASMTAALVVKPDETGQPVRFNAELKKDERTGAVTYAPERRFVEERGSRYIKTEMPGVVYAPSTGVVALALLMNFLLFAVWFVAFWPVLQFSWGHALGFAAALGLVTMLAVMPLLFKPNRTTQTAGPGAAVGFAACFGPRMMEPGS